MKTLRVAVFSAKPYSIAFLDAVNKRFGFELHHFDVRLNAETVSLAAGFDAVCVFVSDTLDAPVLRVLKDGGVRLIALRCAGFNNVDLETASSLNLTVMHVPAYSPHAVAEHAVALMLALNRKLCRAYNRVREGNFNLDGLLGFEFNGRTAGIVGSGRIGVLVGKILSGFGMKLLVSDPSRNPEMIELGARYTGLPELYASADVISLHCPLLPSTHHMINSEALASMKDGVMLINTSRGALIDTVAVIAALKSGKIGYLGLDVYEEESDLFFEDLSGHVLQDDIFARLLTFPNVLITGHQGFFTRTALENIAETTLGNIAEFAAGQPRNNLVTPDRRRRSQVRTLDDKLR